MSYSDCWWTCGCVGKTVKSLENTCHTWAFLRWWFTTKSRYIKCMDLYLYTMWAYEGGPILWELWSRIFLIQVVSGPIDTGPYPHMSPRQILSLEVKHMGLGMFDGKKILLMPIQCWYLFTNKPVCLSVCLSVRPSVRLSIHPSIYLIHHKTYTSYSYTHWVRVCRSSWR